MKLTKEQAFLYDRLSGLEKKFVSNYIQNGRQAAQAIRDTGRKYKSPTTERTSASRILNKPKVKEFIESIDRMELVDSIMTRQEALEMLSIIARAKITDIARMTTVGPVIDVNADMTAVDEIGMTAYGPKVKMKSAENAIKEMSRIQGWEAAFKHDNSKPGGGLVLDLDEAAKRLLFSLERGMRSLEEPKHE